METDNVARNYAEVFFWIVEEKQVALEFLKKLKQTIEDSPEFKSVLFHPYVNRSSKFKAMEKILGIKLSKHMENFLHILMDNYRLKKIDEICREFEEMKMEEEKAQQVKIFIPKEISSEQLDELKSSLKKKFKKKIILEVIIDKKLIAGIKLQIDGKIYDGTIRSRLDNFKHRIVQGEMCNNEY